MKVNRDFEINGVKFHMNDGRKNKGEGKYKLTFYHLGFENWVEISGIINTKKEAIQLAKEFLKYNFRIY